MGFCFVVVVVCCLLFVVVVLLLLCVFLGGLGGAFLGVYVFIYQGQQ